MNKKFYFNTFKNLIYSDLIVFKQNLLDKFIDVSIWVFLTNIVMAYIMPYFGLKHDFGTFQFAGTLAAVGLFELYGSCVDLVSDFEGDRTINYNLTLPIPSWLAILSKAAYYFIIYSILTILMLPIGKISLFYQFSLTQVNYFQLTLAIIAQNIFYACFVLWTSSIIKNMSKLGSVWARFIFPMWFLGGFQFSWTALYNVIPSLGIINLFNPMIYITEATRAAIIGQQGFINFWICILAILFFAGISFYFGFNKLRKRLDFV